MKNKWYRTKDQKRLEPERKEKEKKYRIYLAEPLDYFGVAHQQKIRERERLEKAQATRVIHSWQTQSDNDDISNIPIIGTAPSRPWREEDLRILRRTVSHEGKNTIHSTERRPYTRTAISIPLREVLATRIKSFLHRLTHWKVSTSSPRMEKLGLLTSSDSPRSLRSRQSRTTSESTTFSTSSIDSYDLDQFGPRHVHFAPNTIFCERDDKSPFWSSLLERRQRRAQRIAEKEEKNRPRPFLPFLEAGLSYTSDKEFYQIKNSLIAHKDPQLIMKECKKRDGIYLPYILNPFRRHLCCVLPSDSVHESSHSYPSYIL